LVDFSKDSKFYFNYKIMQGRVFDQLRYLSYGVFYLGIFGLMIIALVTSPLWLTFLFFNIPLIITFGLLLVYTNIFNPLVKLYWRFVFASITLWYRGSDLTLMNVGYADLIQPSGLFFEGEESKVLDRYRLQLYH